MKNSNNKINLFILEMYILCLRQHSQSSAATANFEIHNRWNQRWKCRGIAVLRRNTAKWRAQAACQQVDFNKHILRAELCELFSKTQRPCRHYLRAGWLLVCTNGWDQFRTATNVNQLCATFNLRYNYQFDSAVYSSPVTLAVQWNEFLSSNQGWQQNWLSEKGVGTSDTGKFAQITHQGFEKDFVFRSKCWWHFHLR